MATDRPLRLFRYPAAKIAAIPMILTAVVVFVGGTAWTITYSFTGSKLLPRAQFVGLDQYERLWTTSRWLVSIENLLIYGLCSLVLSFVIGGLVDRLGPKRCILISLVVTVPGAFLFTRSTGFIQTAAVYIIMVIGNAFLWIASSVLLADAIPRNIRGRVMAAMGQGMGVGISGGGYSRGFLLFIPATIGSFLGGYIYDFDPAMPWFILSVFLLLGIALTAVLVKEPEKAEV